MRSVGPLVPGQSCREVLRGRILKRLMDQRVLPTGYRPVQTRECRTSLLADPYIYTHHTVYWFGRLYETQTVRFLEATLRSGGVYIDIGMNLGHFTTVGAERVGSQGRVIAFEPNPKLCEVVSEHFRAQGLDQVEVRNCALGHENGSVTLSVPADTGSSYVSEITERDVEAGMDRISVPMRVGDEELGTLDGSDYVVKIDVEGAELEVLEGMRGLLAERVFAAQVEISPEWLGKEKLTRIASLLEDSGLLVLGASTKGKPQPLDLESVDQQIDIWCVRKDRNPFR